MNPRTPGAPGALSAGDRPPVVIELPAPLEKLARRGPWVSWPLHFAWRLKANWDRDQCSLSAAALAFYGLWSVFPLVLAVVATLGRWLAENPLWLEEFRRFVANFFPGAAGDILGEIKAFSGTDTTTLGLVATLSLLWSGRAYFDTLAWELNRIWPNSQPRTLLQHQMALWSTFLGAGALWALSTTATFALSAMIALSEQLQPRLPGFLPVRHSLLVHWLTLLTSWLLTVLMFWLIYRYLPNTRSGRRGRIALGAALVATLGWEAAKFAFVHFLSNVTRYRATYGGIAGTVLAMLWIYFASMILLLGAEVAAAYTDTCEFCRSRRDAPALPISDE